MPSTKTRLPRDRAQSQIPLAAAEGRPPTWRTPLGWCRRLVQRWARPCVGHGQARPRRRAGHWEAHLAHGQPRTADRPLDLLARAGGYDLRMALYHLML